MNKIEITLDNSIVCGDPKIVINSKHNPTPFCVACKNGLQTIVTELELGAYDTLNITLLDRDHNTHSEVQTSVEISALSIDDINLQHLIFTGTLYPKYDLNFAQQYHPPRSYCPGTIFYTNGVFELDIQLPIHKFLVDSYEQKIS